MDYQLSYACTSHIGKRRKMNQDNFLCGGVYASQGQTEPLALPLTGTVGAAPRQLFGVFDGMGGEERGEAAAFLAAEAAACSPLAGDPVEVLETVCQNANQRICAFVAENGLGICGTTAALLLTDADRLTICNIGDSKIFRLTDRQLTQISEDHLSLAPAGVKPPLSQCLGIPPEELTLCPHYDSLPCCAGDKYLLCSDGLTDMVPPEAIRDTLAAHAPADAAGLLLHQALDNGGRDNITLLILQVESRKTGFWQRLRKLL